MKKDNRGLKNQEFQHIIKNGKYTSSKYYTIYWMAKSKQKSRTGISVSKKYGNAVQRNRARRQIRAFYDEFLDLDLPYDFIIMIRINYKDSIVSKRKNEFKLLLEKIK